MKEKFDITIDGIKANEWKAQKEGRAFIISVVEPDENKKGCNWYGLIAGKFRDVSIMMHSLLESKEMQDAAMYSMLKKSFPNGVNLFEKKEE